MGVLLAGEDVAVTPADGRGHRARRIQALLARDGWGDRAVGQLDPELDDGDVIDQREVIGLVVTGVQADLAGPDPAATAGQQTVRASQDVDVGRCPPDRTTQ